MLRDPRVMTQLSQRRYALVCCGLIWLSFALALQGLDRFPLREDEAIYSFWALHGWRVDPFFLTVWPDKPPLFLGVLALALHFWGASQASGRLLNILLMLLTSLLVGALARRLWGTRSGLAATALYLFNPFALSFAATVYTDPLLVLAGLLALWFACTGGAVGAGFWLGVAIMTKQQGLLYAPLMMAVLWTLPLSANPTLMTAPRWWRFGLGLLLVLVPVFYWDSRRWAVAPSPWDLSVRNYGALHLLPPSQWLARLGEWAKLLWYFTASWPVWLGLGVALVIILYRRVMRDRTVSSKQPVVWWLLLWTVGFLLLHMVTTVQLWDRYLLPLVPIFCLVVGWLVAQVDKSLGSQSPRYWLAMGGLLLLLVAPPAVTAARGGLPIGGDHGDYSGLTEAVAWLKRTAPAGAVLYHQPLGWHYQFYFYDELAAQRLELRWFPTATYLAADAARRPALARFLILPDWAPQRDLPFQLATRHLQLNLLAQFGRMTLYMLQNQPEPSRQPSCSWCLCRLPYRWPVWASSVTPRESSQP